MAQYSEVGKSSRREGKDQTAKNVVKVRKRRRAVRIPDSARSEVYILRKGFYGADRSLSKK